MLDCCLLEIVSCMHFPAIFVFYPPNNIFSLFGEISSKNTNIGSLDFRWKQYRRIVIKSVFGNRPACARALSDLNLRGLP